GQQVEFEQLPVKCIRFDTYECAPLGNAEDRRVRPTQLGRQDPQHWRPSRRTAAAWGPLCLLRTEVCYHGLAKNRHRLVVASALANLFMMRTRLIRLQA